MPLHPRLSLCSAGLKASRLASSGWAIQLQPFGWWTAAVPVYSSHVAAIEPGSRAAARLLLAGLAPAQSSLMKASRTPSIALVTSRRELQEL